jgi:hypothetical protein
MILRISLFVCIVGLMLGCKPEEPVKVQVAKIYFLIGEVTVNGQPGTIGQILKENDIIATGSESRVEMILGDHSGVQLRENCQAEVLLQGSDWQLNVQKGAILNIFARGRRYRLKSPTAVVAIRGTIFYTHVYSENDQYICACNGTIDIDYGTETKRVSGTHHAPQIVKTRDTKMSINSDVMKEHDDVEIFEFMYRMNEALSSEK